MPMISIYMVVFSFFIHTNVVNTPCNDKFSYSVSKNASSGFDIFIEPHENGVYKFVLSDLYTGKILEEKSFNISSHSNIKAFQGLPKSLYTIHVFRDGCKGNMTIGGIEGVKVGI